MTQHKETKVTCGWFFEDTKDWNYGTRMYNSWAYGRKSGLQSVGTPHDCPGAAGITLYFG
jgi:hypothetical protein